MPKSSSDLQNQADEISRRIHALEDDLHALYGYVLCDSTEPIRKNMSNERLLFLSHQSVRSHSQKATLEISSLIESAQKTMEEINWWGE